MPIRNEREASTCRLFVLENIGRGDWFRFMRIYTVYGITPIGMIRTRHTRDGTKSVEWLFTISKTAHLTIVTVKKATHNLTGHNNIVDRHAGNDFSGKHSY